MNEHISKTIRRKPHLFTLRQILVSLVLLVISIRVLSIILLQPGNPKTCGNVMKTANPKTSGDIMKTVNHKSSGYVMKTTYWGKAAPLEFDFTFSDIAEIVKSWRNHSRDMKWKIVDILKISRPVLNATYKNPCFHRGTKLCCMPYYMLIGVAKCGTSELMDKISLHPDVKKIWRKEPNWFDRERLDGISFLQYMKTFSLEKLTKQRAPSVIMGDGTTNTFTDSIYWMDTPENANSHQPEILIPHLVHHLNPQTKLILILRDPVERLYSAYNFFGNKSLYPTTVYTTTPEDFHERAKYNTRWLTQCSCALPRRHCLYDFPYRDRTGLPKFYQRGPYGHSVHQTRMGLYSEYLKDWYSVFPAGQILVVTLEQFSANQTYVLDKIYRHLELQPLADSLHHTQNTPLNANKQGFLPMLTETRALLQEFYRPFNKKLAQMLGKDMFLWGY